MTRRRLLVALMLGATALASACSKTDEPADPVWGKEPCAHCRMLVGDKRYAAQALDDGERRFFDDIGCMVLWTEEHKGVRTWVHDARGASWLTASSARYVEGARTPMDFGFEAHVEDGVDFNRMRDRVLAKKGNDR